MVSGAIIIIIILRIIWKFLSHVDWVTDLWFDSFYISVFGLSASCSWQCIGYMRLFKFTAYSLLSNNPVIIHIKLRDCHKTEWLR